MTRRVFVPSLEAGLGSAAAKVEAGRPVFKPTVEFRRTGGDGGGGTAGPYPGPDFSVVGPGDVLGFDRSQVVRCVPAPGTVDAKLNELVTLDLADARLPWTVSFPGAERVPWIALVVVSDDEAQVADPIGRQLMPTVTAPAAALPDLGDLPGWTHVEARIESDVEDQAALDRLIAAEAHTGTDLVIARLMCPRLLKADQGWTACVVPSTEAGRLAGLGDPVPDSVGTRKAWDTRGETLLPVYYSWTFRTGPDGSFEDLARLLEPLPAADLPGFGGHVVDVSNPWLEEVAPIAGATITVHGALRVPELGVQPVDEDWGAAEAAKMTFRERLTARLDAAARASSAAGGEPADRDTTVLSPPLYGSHATGHQSIPPGTWVEQLNLQVRHRIAASLGARYVQVEQEFLMERAWEQVGEIREANRVLAQAQLAAVAAEMAVAKHLAPMDPSQLTVLADVVGPDVTLGAGAPALVARGVGTVAEALTASAVPNGAAGLRFRRLARGGGAVARRARRAGRLGGAAGEALGTGESVVAAGLSGQSTVTSRPVTTLAAEPSGTTAPQVVVDAAVTYGARTLTGLVGAQQSLVVPEPGDDDVSRALGITQTMSLMVASFDLTVAMAPPTPTAGALRGVRRELFQQAIVTLPPDPGLLVTPVDELAGVVREQMREVTPARLRAIGEVIGGLPAAPPAALPEEPMRRIMRHPRFGFPIGAEILTRWPEWAVPGITTFPANRCTVLETNPAFVEAVMVGLNQELNRELLWREYPTDQAGTPFTRFWPTVSPDVPGIGEIAQWGDGGALGSHDGAGGVEKLALLVRADVLRRFPGTVVLAVQATDSRQVPKEGGDWRHPSFTLPVDDSTCVFGFDLTMEQVTGVVGGNPWMFVVREPMRGTRFGFDLSEADTFTKWSDLTWDRVVGPRGFADLGRTGVAPGGLPATAPQWGRNGADVAAISFQQPFQLAFSPKALIG